MKSMDLEKIDFVLPWVDGNDPVWLAQKRKYEAEERNITSVDSAGASRYRDYGLLRYWFRGVERFAPWVNKVYFITCGQKPDWLDESNPKLRLVNHKDYIPSEYLPTFQSNTIELNLHRIDELSEHFVLFNDDVFLLRPQKPNCFYRNGLPLVPCDLSIPRWLGYSSISRVALNNSGLVMRKLDVNKLVWKNAMKFFNVFALGPMRVLKNFASFAVNRVLITGTFGHLAQPHLKSTLAEMWRIYPNIMERTSRHRFRSDDCINQWLLCSWNMVTGNFYPSNEKRVGNYIGLEKGNLDVACRMIVEASRPQLCINDSGWNENESDFNECVTALGKAFEEVFPQKSSFEK